MPYVNGKYYTEAEITAIRRVNNGNATKGDGFLESALIGAVTGSAVMGGLLGGNLIGGLVGDYLSGDDSSSDDSDSDF